MRKTYHVFIAEKPVTERMNALKNSASKETIEEVSEVTEAVTVTAAIQIHLEAARLTVSQITRKTINFAIIANGPDTFLRNAKPALGIIAGVEVNSA